jgi:tetratricopeptide (TPR) repeat protein
MWHVEQPEAHSLLGEPLPRPQLEPATRRERERLLAEARAAYRGDRRDVDSLIWLGRRHAYLGHYHEAVAIYSEGIRAFPQEPRLYRHRGHRYLTLRQLDRAVTDLERAAQLVAGRPDEIEPDGLPNDRNIPTSTLQTNIWYHLGLAYYLQGELERAASAYRRCLALSHNPDMQCATSHWLYMTLRRLDREDEAQALLEPIRQEMDVIENHAYHRLLMFYKGHGSPAELLAEAVAAPGAVDFATIAYGVGNWYRVQGRPEQAERVWRSVVADREWAAFGHLAAEAELARMLR